MYVITGTSGTGKSTLVAALQQHGHAIFEEPVRKTLSHQLIIDGPALPAKNPLLFVETMLAVCQSDFIAASKSENMSFFDRGIPDLIAYANRFGVDASVFETAAATTRYCEDVFVLPPWEAIFCDDEFRKASFSVYRDFHHLIVKSYESQGYNLIEVPQVAVEARVDFVERVVKKNSE